MKLIVILGPTASGKSGLAVALAKKYNGEIISADSRQVYRGLDLASGKVPRDPVKPTPTRFSLLATRYFHDGIPHHLLDVASLRRVFTVADYKKIAERAIRDIIRRGKLPIIAGGTGLYIDAVLYDQTIPEVKPDPKLRKKLEARSTASLFVELQKLDPARAATIERHNPRRLIRALEIVLTTGRPVPPSVTKRHSNILKNVGMSSEDVLKIGINPGPEAVKRNIQKRILSRLRQGMVAEVRRLHQSGISWKRLEELGLEPRWISRHLRGLATKEEMIAGLEKDTSAYARRQMTWWRKDKDIIWISNSKEVLDSGCLR